MNIVFFGLECLSPSHTKTKIGYFDTCSIVIYQSQLSVCANTFCLLDSFSQVQCCLLPKLNSLTSKCPQNFFENEGHYFGSKRLLHFSENSFHTIPILHYVLFVFETISKTIFLRRWRAFGEAIGQKFQI